MQGLVSIILPLYNAENLIVETIESVRKQVYQNWELLVVDDCSTDSGSDFVESIVKTDSRIKLFRTPENFGGPAGPRNIGLEHARGEYIAFLDADDLWEPNKLQLQCRLFNSNSRVKLICSRALLIDGVGKPVKHKKYLEKIRLKFCRAKFLPLCNFIATSSVIIRKVDIKNSFFDESPHCIAIEDWKLWIILSKNWKDEDVLFLNQPLIKYRVLASSISSRGSNKINKRRLRLYSDLMKMGVIGKVFGLIGLARILSSATIVYFRAFL